MSPSPRSLARGERARAVGEAADRIAGRAPAAGVTIRRAILARLVRSSGLHHVDLVVSSLGRSLPFYRGLLIPLGWEPPADFEGERGEAIWYFIQPGEAGYFGLRAKQSDAHAVPYDRYGVGVHHVCFEAESRDRVDERAAWLREQDAVIESGPGEYSYSPGYYAVFFYDPDGLKLEIAHVPEGEPPSA